MRQTAGVVFVADALGGWLVGLLADAGRKRLTKLVLGNEQQRALRLPCRFSVSHTRFARVPGVRQIRQFCADCDSVGHAATAARIRRIYGVNIRATAGGTSRKPARARELAASLEGGDRLGALAAG